MLLKFTSRVFKSSYRKILIRAKSPIYTVNLGIKRVFPLLKKKKNKKIFYYGHTTPHFKEKSSVILNALLKDLYEMPTYISKKDLANLLKSVYIIAGTREE